MKLPPIVTPRTELRFLDPDVDDLTSYLLAMRSPSIFPFIESARHDYSAEELRHYVEEINYSENGIQYGIFARELSEHVGNIKFHHIDYIDKTCYVGFFIWHAGFRGKGIAGECFRAGFETLNGLFGIEQCSLGVSSLNASAVRAYSKMGFRIDERGSSESLNMTFCTRFRYRMETN